MSVFNIGYKILLYRPILAYSKLAFTKNFGPSLTIFTRSNYGERTQCQNRPNIPTTIDMTFEFIWLKNGGEREYDSRTLPMMLPYDVAGNEYFV